tara:strand:+ start:27340 stop:27603 length:264 start_codon:yes stop_codon:yes gene_type:complete
MDITVYMTILGSFISLLLIVNAYFTRKTLEKMSDIDLRLAVYISKHDNTEEVSRWNREEIMGLRDRVHSLEGSQSQLLEYVKSHDFS